MWMQDKCIELRFINHDHDTKFTEAIDQHFHNVDEGIVKRPTKGDGVVVMAQ
jgi:hypothetical protein